MPRSRPAPRSLTQMLREGDDAFVVDLLLARPDLATPPPTGFSQIASRATTRESVRRALDRTSSLDLWVAQQVADAPRIDPADIDGVEPTVAAAALARLRGQALLWGNPDSLRPVRALAAELEPPLLSAPPELRPPTPSSEVRRDAAQVDKVAAGSAFELVRRVEVLVEHADHLPYQLRQDGGLAHRQLRSAAALIDVPAAIATLHLEVALGAGLLGPAPGGRADVLLPTSTFDAWQDSDLAHQWRLLSRAFRVAHPPSGIAELKSLCFAVYGDPREARVLESRDLQRWVGWHLPRLAAQVRRQLIAFESAAPWIGVTALGALASFWDGRRLQVLEELLPARAETVLVQNDLTAVAPAPLTAAAARELGALADVESRGGATVYRFTVESLRRAHQLGWTPEEMTATLLTRSRTPIPQPLAYLIADLQREAAATQPPPTHEQPPRAAAVSRLGSDELPSLTRRAAQRIVDQLRAAADEEPADPAARVAAETQVDVPQEALSEAAETGEVVWIGYVDAMGARTERVVRVDSIDDGLLLVRDIRTGDPLRIAMHRLVVAHILRGGSIEGSGKP